MTTCFILLLEFSLVGKSIHYMQAIFGPAQPIRIARILGAA